MSALSKLLAKVAIRAIKKSNTEAELTDVADKVITWSNANLITEQHVDAIANSMEEDVDGGVEAIESVEEPIDEPEITEQHVDAIANSMEEDVDGGVEDVEESVEEPIDEPEIAEETSE